MSKQFSIPYKKRTDEWMCLLLLFLQCAKCWEVQTISGFLMCVFFFLLLYFETMRVCCTLHMHVAMLYERKRIFIIRKGEFGLHHSYLCRPDNPVLPFFRFVFGIFFNPFWVVHNLVFLFFYVLNSIVAVLVNGLWMENSLASQRLLVYWLLRMHTELCVVVCPGTILQFIRSIIINGPDI